MDDLKLARASTDESSVFLIFEDSNYHEDSSHNVVKRDKVNQPREVSFKDTNGNGKLDPGDEKIELYERKPPASVQGNRLLGLEGVTYVVAKVNKADIARFGTIADHYFKESRKQREAIKSMDEVKKGQAKGTCYIYNRFPSVLFTPALSLQIVPSKTKYGYDAIPADGAQVDPSRCEAAKSEFNTKSTIAGATVADNGRMAIRMTPLEVFGLTPDWIPTPRKTGIQVYYKILGPGNDTKNTVLVDHNFPK